MVSENKQLAEKLHKPMIGKFEKRKVNSFFKDNIWGPDLADMQLISKYNEGLPFLSCVMDIYNTYAGGVALKDKKSIAITVFQNILHEFSRKPKFGRKPNKIWVDKSSGLYNRSMKSWLQNNNIEIYSTRSEGKSVAVERFIRTLKIKIYKYMTSKVE